MTKTRNKPKIIGLLLTLVMLVPMLGIFSLTASADEKVVAWKDTNDDGIINSGETTYTKLNHALAAGGTIKLGSDYYYGDSDEHYISMSSGTAILDLNGHTLSFHSLIEKDIIVLSGTADLTITDSKTYGVMSCTNRYDVKLSDSSKLTIAGGTIKTAVAHVQYCLNITKSDNAVFEITGGKHYSWPNPYVPANYKVTTRDFEPRYAVSMIETNEVVAWNDADNDGVIDSGEQMFSNIDTALAAGVDLKMNSDIFRDSKSDASKILKIYSTKTIDLNGYSIVASAYCFKVEGGTLTIKDSASGGLIWCQGDSYDAISILTGKECGLIVESGTILGGILKYSYSKYPDTVVLKGGNYDIDPSKYIKDSTLMAGQDSSSLWGIRPAAENACSVTIGGEYFYTGEAITPTIVVTELNSSAILTENVDYTVSLTNNVNIGTATATVTFINDYRGSITETFTIGCDHSISEHTTATDNGDGKHSFTCTVCGDFITEDHAGGSATCIGQECEECGARYGEVDKTNHNETASYVNGFCPGGCYEPAVLNGEKIYEINNAGQLLWYANYLNTVDNTANGKLTANIVLNENVLTAGGALNGDGSSFIEWTPINDLRGTFDGNGHYISGLYFNDSSVNYVGFASSLHGEIKNLGIVDSYVRGGTRVAAFAGQAWGNVTNCHNEGTVVGNKEVGGIIGYTNGGEVTNCYNLGNISGGNFVGGIVAYGHRPITNCYNEGTVTGTAGIAISDTETSIGQAVGGIVGYYNNSAVTNCYNKGTISGVDRVGGIAGWFNNSGSAAIVSCFNVGTVSGTTGTGGVLGHNNGCPVTASYYLDTCGATGIYGTAMTREAFASGLVTYLLGDGWGQKVGTDTLPVLGGEALTEGYYFYGQQLNIGSDLSMKYYVIAFNESFDVNKLTLQFFFLGELKTVSAIASENKDFYYFTLDGINPQCMGDSINATLFYDGDEVNKLEGYSVEKNLNNLLEAHADNAALVALIKDTLAYGKVSSDYKQHPSITENYIGSDREIPEASVTLEAPFTGYTVRFGVKNYIKIGVTLTDGNRLYLNDVEITDKLAEDGTYTTAGIAPTEFAIKYKFEVRANDGTTVVKELTLSVNDYAYVISQNTNTSDTMKALAKALYNYGVSAEEYADSQNN